MKIIKRNPKYQMIKKVHLDPVTLPIRIEIINPPETSPAETFKGAINKKGILLETSLLMTYKEGIDRERTPRGITRGTHSKETLIIQETVNPEIITEIIIENIHHGGTRAKTNPHGMYKTRETQEDNPQGETREVVTQ